MAIAKGHIEFIRQQGFCGNREDSHEGYAIKKKKKKAWRPPNSRNCGPRGSSARGQLFRPPEAAPAPMPAPSRLRLQHPDDRASDRLQRGSAGTELQKRKSQVTTMIGTAWFVILKTFRTDYQEHISCK